MRVRTASERSSETMWTAFWARQKVRARILTQQSQAAQLVPAIKSRLPDWHLANNPQNVGELERLVSKMQLSTREFGCEFLRGDTSIVKKTVHAGRPVRPLDWIIGRCSGCPGVASRKNSSLQRMQRKRKVSVARVDQ